MLHNEFIIGLGGVGGRCINEFRKAQKVRSADSKLLEEKKTKFEFLYIDSNNDILQSLAWEVYGMSVQLEPADIIQLKENGTVPDIESVADLPNIAPWIGGLQEKFCARLGGADWIAAGEQLRSLHGAGQLRRYGRVLFARHASKIRNVLASKIQNLKNGRDSEITFRIFCTLGGGTGSGSVVDMVTLINCMAKEQSFAAQIYLYPFIAGKAELPSDAGSFFENEYAALRDINALMVRKYHPYVVGRAASSLQGNSFEGTAPITQVVLTSEEAPHSPNLQQQTEYVTKACLDAIVYQAGSLGTEPTCLKAMSGEDLVEGAPGEPAGAGTLRSYRFAAYAARRWCVPTEQIKELLKYDCTARVLECWLTGSRKQKGVDRRDPSQITAGAFDLLRGKTIEALKQKCDELIKPLQENRRSIDENEKRDSAVLAGIHDISSTAVGNAQALMSNNMFLSHLETCYNQDAEEFVRTIRDGVDKAIVWQPGLRDVWGLRDIDAFLGQYSQEINDWVSKLVPGDTPASEHDDMLQANMKKREEQWQKLGFATIHLTHLDESMIEWQQADAERRVRDAFIPFSKKAAEALCAKVAEVLLALRTRVSDAVKHLEGLKTEVEDKISAIMGKLAENKESAFGDQFEYDKENLQKVRDAIADSDFINAMAMHFSPAWKEAIGSLQEYDHDKFDVLCSLLDGELCYKTSESMHDAACAQRSLNKVLIGNIIDRLEQIAGRDESKWDERLGPRVEEFLGNIGFSCNYTCGEGLQTPQVAPVAAIVFGLPESAQGRRLYNWLLEKLKAKVPTEYHVMKGRKDVYKHKSNHEIRVLYMPYWMPARFVNVVNEVYTTYQGSVQTAGGETTVYFANIDDNDNGLDSKNRPALTTEGDVDVQNVQRFALAEKLFVRCGEEKLPIVARAEGSIVILQEVDGGGQPVYSRNRYPESMLTIPSTQFRNELKTAILKAKEAMTAEDKAAVAQSYADALNELRAQGVNPAAEEYTEAYAKYTMAKQVLGLA